MPDGLTLPPGPPVDTRIAGPTQMRPITSGGAASGVATTTAPAPVVDRAAPVAKTGQALAQLTLTTSAAAARPNISQAELRKLGQNDKAAFFQALLPGALESQQRYGVPAAVILAQAAIESEYGRADIHSFNLFGIKGSGPAGHISVTTTEHVDGKDIAITANFARFHNFEEAIAFHGKVFTNKPFAKAMQHLSETGDICRFVTEMAPHYATAPNYAQSLLKTIREQGLIALTAPPPSPPTDDATPVP